MTPIRLDDDWSYPIHTTGYVSTLPNEPENDALDRLHQAVFDVTGKRVEKPDKPRIGFLP